MIEVPDSGAIPEPEVGQRWVSSNRRVWPRKIIRIQHKDAIEYMRQSGSGPWLVWLSEWRAWARRTGARPA